MWEMSRGYCEARLVFVFFLNMAIDSVANNAIAKNIGVAYSGIICDV
jgi:hypothetical protein